MYITKSDPQLSRPRRLLQNLLAYILYSIFFKNANKNYFLFVKPKKEMKKYDNYRTLWWLRDGIW